LPIKQLVVATNTNDILHRAISANDMSKSELKHSLSPSMDIMVSSNFERLLFDLYDRDGKAVSELLNRFKAQAVSLDPERLSKLQATFDSASVNDDDTCNTIADVFAQTGYLLDPHTAIGVKAGRDKNADSAVPMITLATAHPVKFPDAVVKAGIEPPKLPAHLTDLFEREERYTVLDNTLQDVQQFMMSKLS